MQVLTPSLTPGNSFSCISRLFLMGFGSQQRDFIVNYSPDVQGNHLQSSCSFIPVAAGNRTASPQLENLANQGNHLKEEAHRILDASSALSE